MKKLLLFLLLTASLSFRAQECDPPVNIMVSNVDQTSALINWIDNSGASVYEILIVPAGSEPPTAGSQGNIINSNPYFIAGLNCHTFYDVYIRTVCSGTQSSAWSQVTTFTTLECDSTLPDFNVCDTNNDGTELVDLSVNDLLVVEALPDGFQYDISYHLTEQDAQTGANALPMMFMPPTSPITIYVRAQVVGNPSQFYVLSYNIVINASPIFPNIPVNEECDDNGDGFAIFDLGTTAEHIWMNTGQTPNTLMISFHETLADAQANVNMLASPYGNITSPTQILYISITNLQTGCTAVEQVLLSAVACSGITMASFIDANGNGMMDTGEHMFPVGQFSYILNNDGVTHYLTGPNGSVNIYDENTANSYDLSFTIPQPYASYYNASTTSYTDITVSESGLTTYLFPVTVTQNYNDLAVALMPLQAPMPGFTYTNMISYTNMGTQTMSGTVSFSASELVTITQNSEPGAVPTTTGFSFNFTDLMPFETRTITVTMQVPTLPTVTLGNLLSASAMITPTENDLNPQNNFAALSQIIIGSYDPNDKMESHGSQILVSDLDAGGYLTYTIRFENTGSATATSVRIEDFLSPQLDPSTVLMLGASHDYVLERVGNQLIWRFDPIVLQPTLANPEQSTGFVQFMVRPFAGYAAGDIVQNTASIYFDFNPAIVTNTFETQIVNFLAVGDFAANEFKVYPNPANSTVNVSAGDTGIVSGVVVSDMLGKIITTLRPAVESNEIAIDVSALSPGMYLLRIESGTRTLIKKLIVK